MNNYKNREFATRIMNQDDKDDSMWRAGRIILDQDDEIDELQTEKYNYKHLLSKIASEIGTHVDYQTTCENAEKIIFNRLKYMVEIGDA